MNEKIRVELGPVQETLLIPLLGRAEETKRGRGIINDEKAVEIVESLDYDFSKWRGIPSLVASAIRTRMFDEDVSDFLRCYPNGTVVEIGAGLNTRYERLDNGRANWVELDLPDSMALRRKFFADTERRHMLSANVLDTDWHDKIAAFSPPYCFVSEAVIIYLDDASVERAIGSLTARFPRAWLITDTTSTTLVDGQDKHDAMKKMSKESWFRWRCDDPEALEQWGLRLKRSRTFMNVPSDIRRAMPLSFRMLLRFLPWMVKKRVQGYHINRFHLGGHMEPTS